MALKSLEPAQRLVRSNRFLLYALAGFVGGAVGAIVAELVRDQSGPTSVLVIVVYTATWAAVVAAVISVALAWAGVWYRRRGGVRADFIAKAALWGIAAGVAGGAIAQFVYGFVASDSLINEVLVRPIAWSIMGAIVGVGLVQVIPNLTRGRAALGGLVGGIVGSWFFSLASFVFTQSLGRSIGMGAVGAGIGLAVLVVEALTREGYLEVIWAPNEVTTISIGSTPVTLGGGTHDDIFINGLPSSAAAVLLRDGQVNYIDGSTEQETPLRNGSKIRIGQVEIVVRTVDA